ncbi:hypothetical protein DL766_007330 [Monosporascus sp. MC13-8B]|uniref:Uncharacterized protein n=1 Tax=Monosporascus cannonballus TaxID=155416 RepID=A0ABY0GRB9_9PEZI|nr:hypothetical protein DL763_010291 [Monosporascus cannonballus]RYO75117.1 hypothetical protein DL762_010170 [Monosporascus cannonballus]RYP24258.1 hypothetical protein DL766_007330 [Monosporascus sp. MC13-8B]
MKAPIFLSPATALGGGAVHRGHDKRRIIALDGSRQAHQRTAHQVYMARIEQANPETSPDALSITEALDKELSDSGIPWTDARHLAAATPRKPPSSRISGRGGAPPAGHASLSEAAGHKPPPTFSDDYSPRAGQIRKPFNPTQGRRAAVAVTPRSCAAVKPPSRWHRDPRPLVHSASHLGLYTLNSTPGLKPRHGVDVALRLDIMAVRNSTTTSRGIGRAINPQDGYSVRITNDDSLDGMKLGLPWNPYWSTKPSQLQAAGTEIVNIFASSRTDLHLRSPSFAVIRTTRLLEEIADPYGFVMPASTPGRDNQLSLCTASGLRNWTPPAGDEWDWMGSLAEMAGWKAAHNESQTLCDEFRTNFGWDRRTARAAADEAHAHRLEYGKPVVLDALLVPNDDVDSRAGHEHYGQLQQTGMANILEFFY